MSGTKRNCMALSFDHQTKALPVTAGLLSQKIPCSGPQTGVDSGAKPALTTAGCPVLSSRARGQCVKRDRLTQVKDVVEGSMDDLWL
jgi:hypothetical protein